MPNENVSLHKVPEQGEVKGFLHFYKKGDKWHYVAEKDFEEKKKDLPPISFAIKYPINDLESKPFPEIEELLTKLDSSAQPDEQGLFHHKEIANNNIANKKDKEIVGPRYLAASLINGGDYVINTHEQGFTRM